MPENVSHVSPILFMPLLSSDVMGHKPLLVSAARWRRCIASRIASEVAKVKGPSDFPSVELTSPNELFPRSIIFGFDYKRPLPEVAAHAISIFVVDDHRIPFVVLQACLGRIVVVRLVRSVVKKKSGPSHLK